MDRLLLHRWESGSPGLVASRAASHCSLSMSFFFRKRTPRGPPPAHCKTCKARLDACECTPTEESYEERRARAPRPRPKSNWFGRSAPAAPDDDGSCEDATPRLDAAAERRLESVYAAYVDDAARANAGARLQENDAPPISCFGEDAFCMAHTGRSAVSGVVDYQSMATRNRLDVGPLSYPLTTPKFHNKVKHTYQDARAASRRVAVRLRVAPVHARRRGRGRLECWSFLPQIALPPSPLCLRPRAAVALMSRLALEMSRLARNRRRSELRCHELKRRLRARAGSARSGAIKPRAAGAPPVAGVCDRTRAHDKVPSSEALAQLAACTSQSEGQEFEELQDWAAFGRCAVFCCAQN